MIPATDGVYRQFQDRNCEEGFEEEFKDPLRASIVMILRLRLDGSYNLFNISEQHAKLDHKPAFQALSYSRGASIALNTYTHRKAFGTTEGRLISVRWLHNLGLPRTVWVDALCVNQSCLGEREKKECDFRLYDVFSSCIRRYIQSQFWSETLRLSKRREKAPGTYEWLSSNDKFFKWKNTKDKSLLWISGSTGAGKSTLCSAIIDGLEANRSAGDIVTSYFIDGRITTPNIVFNILRTMAAGVLLSAHSSEYIVRSKALLMDLDTAGEDMSLLQMREFLLRIRYNISSGETLYLVLDGWDDLVECQRISYLIWEILNVVNGHDGSTHSMKFLISSRSDIPHGRNHQGVLVVNIDTEISVRNDVAAYLQYELSRFKRLDHPKEKDNPMLAKNGPLGAVRTTSEALSSFKPVSTGHQKLALLPSAISHNWDEAYLRIKCEVIDKGKATFLWARLLIQVLHATNQSHGLT